ncbi:hypothetical protein DL96DRAFT_1824728 [Flagelloscypha sp. PMI_526]|nr:hypothetical protein DL96DRAFT_1824728 [Flagelloscypha sp. PMI_526]
MSPVAETSGTLYDISVSGAGPSITATAFMPLATTYALGVGNDGATTYIVSEVITKFGFLNSAGSGVSSYTEPQTIVETFVAGASYQEGAFQVLATDKATATKSPADSVPYSCSYDVTAGTGRCVEEHTLFSRTTAVTIEGTLVPYATFTPFAVSKPLPSTSWGHKNKAPAFLSVIVAGVIGCLVIASY